MTPHELSQTDHPFLKNIKPEFLQILSKNAFSTVVFPGQKLIKEGDQARFFYLIISGKISIGINTPQKGDIIFETISDGDILGWSWLTYPHFSKFNGIVIDETKVIAMDGDYLRNVMKENCELGQIIYSKMLPVIVERLSATRLQLLDIYYS